MPALTLNKINDVVEEFDIDADKYSTFIESGTCDGDSINRINQYFEVVHTIEVAPHFHQMFLNNYSHLTHVTAHLGDSSKVIPQILPTLTEDACCVFWLDGHYSSGSSGKGDKDVPLIEECNAINETYKPDEGIVLVDDYRLFGTDDAEDWSQISVDNLLECFTNFDVQQYVHADDMLVFYINRKK